MTFRAFRKVPPPREIPDLSLGLAEAAKKREVLDGLELAGDPRHPQKNHAGPENKSIRDGSAAALMFIMTSLPDRVWLQGRQAVTIPTITVFLKVDHG